MLGMTVYLVGGDSSDDDGYLEVVSASIFVAYIVNNHWLRASAEIHGSHLPYISLRILIMVLVRNKFKM